MRKILLSALLAVTFSGVFAQKIEDVKEKVQKGKYDEAKEKIDKMVADPKNAGSSDVWFYQSVVYANLSKANPADATLSATALSGMKKYMDLEKSNPEGKRFLFATLEGDKTFFDIYQGYFKSGVKNFQAQKYDDALVSFKGALDAFDYLSKNNLTTVKFDTTSTIYAGFSAQNAKKYEEAAKYYDLMVKANIKDTSYLDAYIFLINYNLQNKDTAAAQRYLAISEKTFPAKSETWLDYEIAFLGNDKPKRIQKYEEILPKYPNNFPLAMDYAIELFNYAFTNEKKPVDYVARAEKSKNALQNALAINPNSALANYVMSQYVMNEIYDIDDSIRAVKGTTPADQNKKKNLNARMDLKYQDLYTYSQKAYDLYSKEASLKIGDKVNYRRVIGQLVDYYQRKKQTDKVTFYQDKLKQLQ